MKLYQFPLSPRCQMVVALAHEVGIPLETIQVDLFKGEARSPAIVAKNPNARVPILEDEDFVLWESTAILGYIASKADRRDLAPSAPRERADVDRWLAWQTAHFGPAVAKVAFERIVKKLGGLGPPDEAIIAKGMDEFAATSRVLNHSLAGKEYLCGRLTIADFCLITYATLAESSGLDYESAPNVKAWLARMTARPSVRQALAARGTP